MEPKDKIRLRIAQNAARIMVEEGVSDYGLAGRKAATRLGVRSARSMPRAEEIQAALLEYHRIYRSADQSRLLARLRKLAAEAMEFLAEFSPLLVGGAWDGSAGKFSPVSLHLFVDEPEQVMRKLLNARIPYREDSHSVAGERSSEFPSLVFFVDGTEMQLLLFPSGWKGRTLSGKGRKLAGGSLKELRELMLLDQR